MVQYHCNALLAHALIGPAGGASFQLSLNFGYLLTTHLLDSVRPFLGPLSSCVCTVLESYIS
jgi:hypothetical protein